MKEGRQKISFFARFINDIFAGSCFLFFGSIPLSLQAQVVEGSGSLLSDLLNSIQDDLSLNSYVNLSSSQIADINASIYVQILGDGSGIDQSRLFNPVTAKLGPLSALGIGSIMPESVLNLQSEPLSATINQSDITGKFNKLQIAQTDSIYASHADNNGDVSGVPTLVVNTSINASTIITTIDLQMRNVTLSLQEATAFGVGSAISGQIYNSTTELQFSLVGARN